MWPVPVIVLSCREGCDRRGTSRKRMLARCRAIIYLTYDLCVSHQQRFSQTHVSFLNIGILSDVGTSMANMHQLTPRDLERIE